MAEQDQLTPGELIKEYPQLRAGGWNERFLGSLLLRGILTGKIHASARPNLIDIKSFKSLLILVNNNLDEQKIEL